MVDLEKETLLPHTATDYTKESVKLTRNSKGYTWEIKCVGTETASGLFSEKDFERHKKLDEKYRNEYGEKE